MLLLPGERAGLCRRGDDGGIFNPLAARRLATAETQTPLGTHLQRGQAGQVAAGEIHHALVFILITVILFSDLIAFFFLSCVLFSKVSVFCFLWSLAECLNAGGSASPVRAHG